LQFQKLVKGNGAWLDWSCCWVRSGIRLGCNSCLCLRETCPHPILALLPRRGRNAEGMTAWSVMRQPLPLHPVPSLIMDRSGLFLGNMECFLGIVFSAGTHVNAVRIKFSVLIARFNVGNGRTVQDERSGNNASSSTTFVRCLYAICHRA
jgi:hypothetical protein